MPRRSMSPSTDAVTLRSLTPRLAATVATPALRQPARPASTVSTGVGPWSSEAKISGWSPSTTNGTRCACSPPSPEKSCTVVRLWVPFTHSHRARHWNRAACGASVSAIRADRQRVDVDAVGGGRVLERGHSVLSLRWCSVAAAGVPDGAKAAGARGAKHGDGRAISWRSAARRPPRDRHGSATSRPAARRTVVAMTTSTFTGRAGSGAGHDWRAAGAAWGHSADDWACFYEHYALEVIVAMFERLGVGPGLRLLDVACGAGLAVRHAGARGATVHGIDAAEALIDVARARNPGADLRIGSMFELPWRADEFDAVVSVNGIWGGCEAALLEAHRVLRPGGLIGISFWGSGPPLDLRACFKAFARHAPEQHFGSMKRLNDIAHDGVAERMLRDAGFDVVERGSRVSTIEWPDADTAWRAVTSTGPAVPALRHGDRDALRRDVLAAIEPCRDHRGVYRLRNDHQFVIARRPGGEGEPS